MDFYFRLQLTVFEFTVVTVIVLRAHTFEVYAFATISAVAVPNAICIIHIHELLLVSILYVKYFFLITPTSCMET